MTTWDDDSWWENTAPIMFGAQAWESAPQQVEHVLALAGLEPPIRVLDLPCGPGRHTLEFARLGCSVTGVDRTAAYLEQARRKAQEAGLEVEFVQADMREFRCSEAVDLAVNLFTSFGFFEDQDEDFKVLGNFYASLRPGGTLIMDLMGKEVLARIFRPRDWHTLDDGTLVLEERSVKRDWTWIECCWTMIRGNQRQDFPFSYRLYGASDLERLLALAGFDPIRMYGDLAGAPYDHNAQRLVAVAHKPGAGE